MKNTYGFSDEVFGYLDANVTLEADMFIVTFHANHYNPRKIGTYLYLWFLDSFRLHGKNA